MLQFGYFIRAKFLHISRVSLAFPTSLLSIVRNEHAFSGEQERGNSSRKLLVPVIKRNRGDKRSFRRRGKSNPEPSKNSTIDRNLTRLAREPRSVTRPGEQPNRKCLSNGAPNTGKFCSSFILIAILRRNESKRPPAFSTRRTDNFDFKDYKFNLFLFSLHYCTRNIKFLVSFDWQLLIWTFWAFLCYLIENWMISKVMEDWDNDSGKNTLLNYQTLKFLKYLRVEWWLIFVIHVLRLLLNRRTTVIKFVKRAHWVLIKNTVARAV